MIVSAWKTDKPSPSGAGYGLQIKFPDREKYFVREWGSVILDLEGHDKPVTANIDKKSFWTRTCGELIQVEIGKWFINNDLVPWEEGKRPKFVMEPQGENRFSVKFQRKGRLCPKCKSEMKVISKYQRLMERDELGGDLSDGEEAEYIAAKLGGEYGEFGITEIEYECPKCGYVENIGHIH